MNIRVMRPDDYDGVYDLWLSCAGMGLNDLDDSREGVERFLKRNPDTCFVAELDGGIAGVIMAGNDGRRGYIYHTAVAEGYRRRGIAKSLVDCVLQAFRKIGINKVACVVFSANEGGNIFWEKLGFTAREDLVYRNIALTKMTRIDT